MIKIVSLMMVLMVTTGIMMPVVANHLVKEGVVLELANKSTCERLDSQCLTTSSGKGISNPIFLGVVKHGIHVLDSNRECIEKSGGEYYRDRKPSELLKWVANPRSLNFITKLQNFTIFCPFRNSISFYKSAINHVCSRPDEFGRRQAINFNCSDMSMNQVIAFLTVTDAFETRIKSQPSRLQQSLLGVTNGRVCFYNYELNEELLKLTLGCSNQSAVYNSAAELGYPDFSQNHTLRGRHLHSVLDHEMHGIDLLCFDGG